MRYCERLTCGTGENGRKRNHLNTLPDAVTDAGRGIPICFPLEHDPKLGVGEVLQATPLLTDNHAVRL